MHARARARPAPARAMLLTTVLVAALHPRITGGTPEHFTRKYCGVFGEKDGPCYASSEAVGAGLVGTVMGRTVVVTQSCDSALCCVTNPISEYVPGRLYTFKGVCVLLVRRGRLGVVSHQIRSAQPVWLACGGACMRA